MTQTHVSRLALVAGLTLVSGVADVSAQEIPMVQVAKIGRGRLKRVVRQAATLEPYERVMVFARATGYARSVNVDVGDEVEAGEALAVLDMPEQEAELRAVEAQLHVAAANVERAQAQVELKNAFFQLTSDLFDKKGRNKFQLDEAAAQKKLAEAELKLAHAELAGSEAKFQRVRALTAYGRIKAPFAGVVTQRLVDTGALVLDGTASGTMPLFEVQRLDKLRCRIEIPERDALLVVQSFRKSQLEIHLELGPGGSLRLSFSADDLMKIGARFSRSLHPRSHHMIAEVDIPNAEGSYLPGSFARATLTARHVARDVVPLLPNVAIQAPRKRERPYVFVASGADGETTVTLRDVKLGDTDGGETEVLEGLEGDEIVVVRGAAVLLDKPQAQAVKVKQAGGGEETRS